MILGGVATPPFLCYNFSSVKYNMLSDALIEALRVLEKSSKAVKEDE